MTGARPWHRAAYRRLWTAAAVSQAGDWLLFIALPLAVLHRSGSALATATVFLAELVPAVIAGLICGPLVDRIAGHRLLSVLTAVQVVAITPLLWLGPGRLWLAYLVAGAQAALAGITAPAEQALVPRLVTPGELPRANAAIEAAGNVARLAGAPLGGALLPIVGLDGLVGADALSFVVAAVLLAGCRPADAPAVTAPAPAPSGSAGMTGALRAIGDGWAAARRSPMLFAGLVVSFVGGIAQGLFLVLFVLFVLRSLHAGDSAVGLLRGVQAIGGVAGGVVVGAMAARLGTRRLAVWGMAGFGFVSLVVWDSPVLTRAPAWYAALFILVGIPAAAFVTGLVTEIQEACPGAVLGRVLSLAGVAQAAGQGAGVLAAGLLSGTVALGVLLNGQGCLYLTCAVVFALGFRAADPRAAPPGRAQLGDPSVDWSR